MIRQNKGRVLHPKTVSLADKVDRSNLWALCPFGLTPSKRDALLKQPDFKLGAPLTAVMACSCSSCDACLESA